MKTFESINLNKINILKTIKKLEPIAIHNIQKEIHLPRTTIVYYLGQLKIAGLIKEKTSEDLGKEKELGSPVYIITNKENPLLKEKLKAFDIILTALKK